MTRTRKVLSVIAALFALAIASLAIAISYESDCAAAPPLSAEGPRMRAILHRCYGPASTLSLEEVARPVPGDEQVLVKVHAAAVNPADWHRMTGTPYIMRLSEGLGAPSEPALGVDYAGTVEQVGKKVTRFKPGDEVFGGRTGAFAEYVAATEQGSITLKPANVSFEQAAALPIAAITALQGLRDQGGIKPGQEVLINGASGGVGTYAVQIAKALGARVTGVCSTRNVEMVRSLGADEVIDYTQENFTLRDKRFDLILDNVGNHPLLHLRKVLAPTGVIVIVGGPKSGPWIGALKGPIKGAVVSKFVDQKIGFFIARLNHPDLAYLAGLASEGKLRSIIDRRYPLAELPAAMEYLGTWRARGKIIVSMD
jgi:NADPH:quinone reductase-like Zn-dependent oxidoreductase